MLILIIANSKKTGNRYHALACNINDKTTFLTFDKTTIVRALDITYGHLESLEIGEYKINSKGELV